MLVRVSPIARWSIAVRASISSAVVRASARAASRSASARSARSRHVPAASPMRGIRPSHFSATLMCASTHSSGSGSISSGRWWMARKSAVTTLRPASRT